MFGKVFKIRRTKFAQKVLDALNSDSEYVEILAEMEKVDAKKKELIKKVQETMKLIHQTDDEYSELEHKRVIRKAQVSKQAAAQL